MERKKTKRNGGGGGQLPLPQLTGKGEIGPKEDDSQKTIGLFLHISCRALGIPLF